MPARVEPKGYLLNGIAEPCPLEDGSAPADGAGEADLPGTAAKRELPLTAELELGSEMVDGKTVWEDSAQVLPADRPAAPLTTANTAGELRAEETPGTDGVLASCQRKAIPAKLWNQGWLCG